jgi:hypothetical protein
MTLAIGKTRIYLNRRRRDEKAFALYGNFWPSAVNRADRQACATVYGELHLGLIVLELYRPWGIQPAPETVGQRGVW